jgi:tetratricopeptide (TPR) repeat protein
MRLAGMVLLGLAIGPSAPPLHAASTEDLMRLLQSRSCAGCRLQDADLVHADLRDADLRGAALQRANLGQARLEGAQLEGADLSFTSLRGASLRGANLRGARLEGTDLRQSDLSGALLDPGALSRTHWQQAVGLDPAQLGYADLHNAGVEAAIAGRHPEAERLFGDAITQQPEAAISWVARGISRSEQGKTEEAAQDLTYAATLYEQGGDVEQANQLRKAATAMGAPSKQRNEGNGLGGQLLSGAAGMIQVLAPLAIKAFVPVGF